MEWSHRFPLKQGISVGDPSNDLGLLQGALVAIVAPIVQCKTGSATWIVRRKRTVGKKSFLLCWAFAITLLQRFWLECSNISLAKWRTKAVHVWSPNVRRKPVEINASQQDWVWLTLTFQFVVEALDTIIGGDGHQASMQAKRIWPQVQAIPPQHQILLKAPHLILCCFICRHSGLDQLQYSLIPTFNSLWLHDPNKCLISNTEGVCCFAKVLAQPALPCCITWCTVRLQLPGWPWRVGQPLGTTMYYRTPLGATRYYSGYYLC